MSSPVKKIAAIHDISGFGRASLTVVIPVISSMGIQVVPLPTAVLSTHGKFDDFHFIDLTDEIQSIVDHWKKIGIAFDAIYSGFLGSSRQISIVERFISDFKQENQLVIVDPVMGDEGKLYTMFNTEMVEGMKRLIKKAKIITPNLTELCYLCDVEIDLNMSINEVKRLAKKLSENGPEYVIVTSVPEKHNKMTSVIAYNAIDHRFWKVSCNYVPANYPGTGDAFASVIAGSLLNGDSLPIALDRAVQFTSLGVRASFGYDYNKNEGIIFERFLANLNAPVQLSSYELLNGDTDD